VNPTPVTTFLAAAEEIATCATRITLEHFRTGFAVERKADASPVTIADRATEAALRAAIAERFPEHGILGEEYGSENMDRDFVWIIDPIDGTKSFISGVPLFGTLLGLLQAGKPLIGAIHMPGLGETFIGTKAGGSTLNGTPIHCRQSVALEDAFLCYNELPTMLRVAPETVGKLMKLGRYQRSTNDCYPYAQLAAGWVDGVVDFDLQPYDYLPVVGVIEGAGGIITDWQGRPLSLNSDGRVIAAASPEIHAALLAAVG